MCEYFHTVLQPLRKWDPQAGLGAAALAIVCALMGLVVAVAGLGVGVELVSRRTELELFALSVEGIILGVVLALGAIFVAARRRSGIAAAVPAMTLLLVAIGVAGFLVTDDSLMRRMSLAAPGSVLLTVLLVSLARRPRRRPWIRVANVMGIAALLMAVAGLGAALAVVAVEVRRSAPPTAQAEVSVTRGDLTGQQQRQLDALLEQLRESDDQRDRGFRSRSGGRLRCRRHTCRGQPSWSNVRTHRDRTDRQGIGLRSGGYGWCPRKGQGRDQPQVHVLPHV